MKYVIIILLICGIELSYSQVDKDNYLKTPNQNYNPANDDHYIYFKKNGILLENKNTHHKIILKEGTNVNIVCLDGKILQGKIYINSDSIISIEKVFFSIDSGTYIENENCSINNIFQIKRGVNLRSGGIGITKIGGVLERIGIPMWIL